MNLSKTTSSANASDNWWEQYEFRFERPKFFVLVQFSRNPHNLVQAVLTENELLMPKGSSPISPDILIKEQQITPGRLLFVSEDKNSVQAEFEKLKQWSFRKAFGEHDTATTIGQNTWILVLYTCHEANVVFAIVNKSETFQTTRDPYADYVCYLNFGDHVYQAIIVRKSESYAEILGALTEMKNSCLKLPFPLNSEPHCDTTQADSPPGFLSLRDSVDEFLQKSDCTNYANAEASLVALEEKLKSDASLLVDWVSALENVKMQAGEHENNSQEA